MRRIVSIVLSGILLLGLLVSSVSAQTNATEVVGGDEASLRLLVSRMAGPPSAEVIGGDEASLRDMVVALAGGGPGFANQKVTVYVAALPPDLPFDLPLPDQTKIIGSVDQGDLGGVNIMLDIPSMPDAVADFYSKSFTSPDWSNVAQGMGTGGFVTQLSTSGQYCYANGKASLSIVAQAQGADSKTSDTHIYVYGADNASLCQGGVTEGGYRYADDPYSLLPQLTTPEGVEIVPNYGGGGGGGGPVGLRAASTSVVLKSALAISDIAAAYNTQLEAAGWKSDETENGTHLTYSGWDVSDTKGAKWAGTFTLVANPAAADQYTATLTVQELPTS